MVELEEEPDKDTQRQWGRLYIRFRMCQILVRSCAWSAYDFNEPTALVNWKERHWTELIALLSETASQCDDEEIAKKNNKVVTSLKLNRSLSAVRCTIERHLQQHDSGRLAFKPKTMEKLM